MEFFNFETFKKTIGKVEHSKHQYKLLFLDLFYEKLKYHVYTKWTLITVWQKMKSLKTILYFIIWNYLNPKAY